MGELARRDEWDMGGLNVTQTQGICSKRCHVGRNGYEVTALVNRLLANGAPATEVYRILCTFPPTSYKNNVVPSVLSIRNHDKNHLPIKVNAMRRVLEKRAAEHGINIEAGTESLLTNLGMAEVIAQKGFAAIIDGKATPTVKETLEAIKISEQFQRDTEDSFSAVEAMAKLQHILEVVQSVVPAEYWAEIDAKLTTMSSVEDAILVEDEDYWEENEGD